MGIAFVAACVGLVLVVHTKIHLQLLMLNHLYCPSILVMGGMLYISYSQYKGSSFSTYDNHSTQIYSDRFGREIQDLMNM